MRFGVGVGEAADPAAAAIVGAVFAERVVNLVDEPQRQVQLRPISGFMEQTEVVARGERVGPQIAAHRLRGRQAGARGEGSHELVGADQRHQSASGWRASSSAAWTSSGSTAWVSSNQTYSSNWAGSTAWK